MNKETNKTDSELEHSKYLEDNSDMIMGTDFLYSHPHWYTIKSRPASGSISVKDNEGKK